MLAAFQIFNLQPGPELFEQNSELVWTLIASLYVGNVMLLALNLPLIRVWVKVLEIPRRAAVLGHPRVRHPGRVLAVGQHRSRCS